MVNGKYRNFATRTILCGVSLHESSPAVVQFAAELAAEQNARLVLQHVIRPQDRQEVLAHRPLDQIEMELRELIPEALAGLIEVQTIVVPGDPTEELLYWSSAEQADLIVLGAQGRVGLCGDYPPGRGIQGAGARALPGDDTFAAGAGAG